MENEATYEKPEGIVEDVEQRESVEPDEAVVEPEADEPQETVTEPEADESRETVTEPEADEPQVEATLQPDAEVAPESPDTSESASHSDESGELAALRAELDDLRTALREREEAFSRMSAECSEFAELYPDTPLRSLPNEVWESVKSGIPLSAAYAYYEVRREREKSRSEKINERNRTQSPGAIAPTQTDYFSPGEVRSMSGPEVRANYQKIIESMKMWH